MMQYEITKSSELFNDRGELVQKGFARHPLLRYDRGRVPVSKMRIKEWDYYCVLAQDHGAAFTIADNGYLGFVSVTLFDFSAPREMTKPIMTLFPMGSFRMPSSSKEGDAVFENKSISLKFLKGDGERTISVDCPNFYKKKSLQGTIHLHQPHDLESMVIVTPFLKKGAFYYNQKINCLAADGSMEFDGRCYRFEPKNSFGVLDWGRGVWTYSNTWYWGSGSGRVNGELFGFNIGYGFGDTSMATENMLFHRGKAHKLEHVSFQIPDNSFMDQWRFTSSDGRFEMRFDPIIDRYSNTDLLVLKSTQHQVFGRFTGRAVLDDGTPVDIRDFLGFAEKVINRW